MSLRRSSIRACLAAAVVAAAACSRPSADAAPQIRLVSPSEKPADAYIEVTGVPAAVRQSVGRPAMGEDDWQRVLFVSVKRGTSADEGIAIAGKYTVHGDTLRFTPSFPFDPGRSYHVKYDPTAIGERTGAITATVAPPSGPPPPPTSVVEVLPSGDVVPENQLRMYIRFSAPMGRRGGVEHIKLLDERGREVIDPFLPLDADLWNGDRTRFTVFFDPGRQKRGILPNRQMGRSLIAGRTYTLVVDRAWEDGNGNPLGETFTRRCRVGPADVSPLDHTKWRVDPPRAGTRDPLTVTFPEPLDHGLLMRAVGVRRAGQPVAGDVRIGGRERQWTMTPLEPWIAGRYELIALSILEDLAGNRIGRAFEVNSSAAAQDPDSDPIAIPFTVGPSER